MFDPYSTESVTRKAPLVKECLQEALAKSKGEKLQWLECLLKDIREKERLTAHLKRWA
jgi:hypothetical protein